VEVIQEAQRAGQVRFIGASTYGEAAALAALKEGRYDCLQIAYNALDHQLESQVFPLAQSMDVGIVIRSVLLKGALTYRYAHLPPELAELKKSVQQLAELSSNEVGSLPELAYRFVLGQQVVASALVGTGRISELDDVLSLVRRGNISLELQNAIQEIKTHPDQLNPARWPIQ